MAATAVSTHPCITPSNASRALPPLQHFVLACNVIGSDAKGTMRRAVQALKSGYETPIFPRLDANRWVPGF